MKFSFKALAALAALSSALVVNAASVPSSTLIVGFKLAGATNDLVLDLGNVTTLTAGTWNVSSALSAAGLSLDPNLKWGAAAYTTAGVIQTDYLTSTWNTAVAGTLGVQNSSSYTTVQNTLNGIATGIQGFQKPVVSTTPVGGTLTTLASLSGTTGKSFSVSTPASTFGNIPGSQFLTTAGSKVIGNDYSASDLLKVSSAGNVEQGTFTFYAADSGSHLAGDLVFTVIPEPSTYAAILGALTIGFVALRRRFSKAV